MSFIYKCDKCGVFYEFGFAGSFMKGVDYNNKLITIDFKIRPQHLCHKCLSGLLKVFVAEIKETYNPKRLKE